MSKRISRILSLIVALVLLITPAAVLANGGTATIEGTVYNDANQNGVFDEGDAPALFVGGLFTLAGDIPSVRIAKWASTCVADFDSDGDGDIDLIDFQAFVECLAGPAGGLGPDCAVFDENGDSHVDLYDFRGFQVQCTHGR